MMRKSITAPSGRLYIPTHSYIPTLECGTLVIDARAIQQSTSSFSNKKAGSWFAHTSIFGQIGRVMPTSVVSFSAHSTLPTPIPKHQRPKPWHREVFNLKSPKQRPIMIASWGFELQTADTHTDPCQRIFRPTEVVVHFFLIVFFSTNEASM
jgi:hypothetical protein